MNKTMIILEEPPLNFRLHHRMCDPHDGLALLGPFDTDLSSHPKNISYALIGTVFGISLFKNWVNTITEPILTPSNFDKRIWPHYPGFEAAYFSTFSTEPVWKYELDKDKLRNCAIDSDQYRRVFNAVGIYLEAMEIAQKRDEAIDLIVCIIPDLVWENCRVKSRVIDGIGHSLSANERRLREKGQHDMFDEFSFDQFLLSLDFRRQLKARAMKNGIPLQLIRESTINLYITIEEERNLSPITDRAWNLSTTLFYKAGGKPWRLATARDGVCYIGIAFKKTPFGDEKTACCAAQMFLDTGDGIVFLSDAGPWRSPAENQCHLSRNAAKNLINGILKTYKEMDGRDLREIFIHSRSTINDEEYLGFQDACPSGAKIIGIRVRQEHEGLKLFRNGKWPVLRGTSWVLSDNSAYLWTSGFKQRLGSYDGWEIPNPLRIDIEHGEAEINQVVSDIFSLTKLNYNACKLGDSEPVTIKFSDAVGEILVSNPAVTSSKPNFKFYI
jgi:hypothetical protein